MESTLKVGDISGGGLSINALIVKFHSNLASKTIKLMSFGTYCYFLREVMADIFLGLSVCGG